MPYVTGAAILAHVAGTAAPSTVPADEAWADTVAAAIEGEIETGLDGRTVDPGSPAEAALTMAALQDGAAAYLARKAPHGIMTAGPDGDAVRLGADALRALRPVLGRYGPTGIG